ncbi:ATP-binding protein [Paraglaciecola sp.]|uniref:hybrid sensor histidine kinase/response regulator transcription factor n=1 Tax=Paraglaciecola sp. TaxID=1920173 RepID=UPI0032645BEF
MRTIVLYFFLLSEFSYSSTSTLNSQNVFSDQSIGVINAIHQGKDTIWLATENGLVGLLGSQKTVYDSTNSFLSEEKIYALLEDELGRVWLATYGGGIYIFDPYTQAMLNISTKDGLVSDNCFDLAMSGKGKVYAACQTGLASIDIHSLKTENLLAHISQDTLKPSSIYSLAIDTNDDIWFSQGNSGVFVYSNADHNLTNYNTDNAQLHGVQVQTIYVDRQSQLWVGTELGLNKWDADHSQFSHFPYQPKSGSEHYENASSNITSIFEDSAGVLWVGAKKLLTVNHINQTVELAVAISSQLQNELLNIFAIDESNQGELLIASFNIGLSTLPATRSDILYLNLEKGGLKRLFTAAYVDQEHILLGGRNNLYSYSFSTKQLKPLKTNIGEVTVTSEMLNKIYVATDNKRFFVVTKSDMSVQELKLNDMTFLEGPRSTTTGLVADADGNLIFLVYGTNAPGVYKVTPEGLVVPVIIDIHPTMGMFNHAGELVVATFGQGQFAISGDTVRPIANNEVLKDLMGRCQYEDQLKNLWLCTNDGLKVLEKGSTKYKAIESNLTGNANMIHDIVQDTQGYYWVTTNKGLVRYDHIKEHSIKIGMEEGVIDTDFQFETALNLLDSKIFIGGDLKSYVIDTRALNVYLDNRIDRKTKAIVTDIVVSDRESGKKELKNRGLSLNKNETKPALELNHNEYLLTIKFTVDNYHERALLEYEYRLQGLNDDWINAKARENSATYTTLPAGDYEFHVRVFDPKSQAVQPITSLAIKVHPPYWLTWQAKALYLTLLVSILVFIYWLRTRHYKKMNAALEKAVLQRTTELQKSNQQVSSLLKQKQHLFANVSHEIRTPLSLMIGPLELLLNKISEPNMFRQASLINRNAKRLQNLVEQILELEKLETINQPSRKLYRYPDALKLIVESFTPYAISNEQVLICDATDTVTLELVEDSFEKIISNLLSNAIKYTPKGGTISVTSEHKNEWLYIQISDTGMGIEADQLKNIFERFTRLQSTISVHGTGIGLALVKELVKANSGKISVKSEQGKGSVFTVELPISKKDATQQLVDTTFKPSVLVPTVELQQDRSNLESIAEKTEKASVLVVEDNNDMRDFIMSCLEDEYHCISAENGQKGLALAIETIPELIISDVMMPVMDGFELAKNIRGNEETSHIPIILLTAKGDEDSRLSGWRNEVDDYIVKPFNVSELHLRVARLISIREILKKRYSREAFGQSEKTITEGNELSFQNIQDQKFYNRFTALIKEHYTDENFNRRIAAEKLAISERQLNRKLGALIDYNFSEFLRKYRLEEARKAIIAGRQITEVSYSVGFSSPSYFSTCFKAEFGVSPANLIL